MNEESEIKELNICPMCKKINIDCIGTNDVISAVLICENYEAANAEDKKISRTT